MRSRLERQIEQRTQMLSGVSHDLRTPLTRMKLTLALMDESEETRDLLQDTDQMERMLGEFLAFARGDSREETVPTDPFALAERVAEDARRAGAEVTLVRRRESACATPSVPLRARRGGAGADEPRRQRRPPRQPRAPDGAPLGQVARLRGRGRRPRHPRGRPRPGAPALHPPRRGAPADAGGGSVGLGLSIAMDVARSHGGSLELGESAELGGLRATFRMPR